MCLTVNPDTPKHGKFVAVEDVVCYKVLYKKRLLSINLDWWKEATYVSPYRYHPYNLGKHTAEMRVLGPYQYDEGVYLVDKGLHTFADLDSVAKMAYAFNQTYVVLVKCRIPKDTEYYSGMFELPSVNSYTSAELILDEVIPMPKPDTDFHIAN